MTRCRPLCVASLLLAACAHRPDGPPAAAEAVPPAGAAQPPSSGAVSFVAAGSTGLSATFDPGRIVGPQVDLALTGQGTWAGTAGGRTVSLEITGGHLAGAGVDLVIERTGDAIAIGGTWFGRRVQLRVDGTRVRGTADGGRCAVDLRPLPEQPGTLGGEVGCAPRRGSAAQVTAATMVMDGAAADLARTPLPQLALALIAVLPA